MQYLGLWFLYKSSFFFAKTINHPHFIVKCHLFLNLQFHHTLTHSHMLKIYTIIYNCPTVTLGSYLIFLVLIACLVVYANTRTFLYEMRLGANSFPLKFSRELQKTITFNILVCSKRCLQQKSIKKVRESENRNAIIGEIIPYTTVSIFSWHISFST